LQPLNIITNKKSSPILKLIRVDLVIF